MSHDLLLAFAVYAFVTSITPGPNNIMLLASGINHGFARSIPHICGVSLGVAFMLIAVGAGLHGLFAALPWLHGVLRWAGAAYLLWLAWKIAHAAPVAGDAKQTRPITFLQAAAFQWVNPKCWVMVMGALTTYLPEQSGLGALAMASALFAIVNVPCVGAWASVGATLRHWLSDSRTMRVFNIAVAALLVLSLYPLVTTSA